MKISKKEKRSKKERKTRKGEELELLMAQLFPSIIENNKRTSMIVYTPDIYDCC